MTSIETYCESIASLKAHIENLKRHGKVCITSTDGTASYVVTRPSDLDLKWGAVIIDSKGEVYLRTAGTGREYWRAAEEEPYYRDLDEMYAHILEQASNGTTYRFLKQTARR
nr:MAG TPA: hypothetical protein [Caudoviricetes sp.]